MTAIRRRPPRQSARSIRGGMGMGQIRVSSPERRDRLWLLNALAVALLTGRLYYDVASLP